MIVADANVVIAASNPSGVHHTEATSLVLEHGQHGIVRHFLALAEMLVGPARAGARVQARHRLDLAGSASPAPAQPS